MSEASKAWRVEANGRQHEIGVEHSTMTGKIVVKLDGQEIEDDRMLLTKKPIEFEVDAHPARVTVEFTYGGFGANSTLHFDDRYVEPLAR